MATFFVNIGSNLGDRLDNLKRAIHEIENRFGYCRVSNIVESEPWGFDSTNSFVNIGVAFQSDLSPLEVLKLLQNIEKSISPELHRDTEGNYIDRIIDIDIMAIDNLIINTPDLKIPHPHLRERSFFMIPLRELAPDWVYPLQDYKT